MTQGTCGIGLYQVDTEENNGDDDQHERHDKNEVHDPLELLCALVASVRRAAAVARGAHATVL